MDGMDRRMNEIARMAEKMQRDFDNTRLVVTKLEEVGNKVLEEKERRKKTESRSPEHPTECDCDDFHGDATKLQLTDCSNFTADELLERALDTTRRGADVTRDDLHELFKALSPRQPEEEEKTKEEDEKRRRLLEWMEKKRMEQMKSYKNEVEVKRGTEVHPYAPKANQKMLTRNNWEAMDEDRAAKRKQIQLVNMELRTQEAAGLLTDLLSDQPNLSKPVIDRPIKTADTTLSRYHPSAFDTSRTAKGTTRSMGKFKLAQNDYCEYLELLESCEREAEMILKGGNAVEVTARREEKRSPERRLEIGRVNGKGKAGEKTYQLKSFRDVVKLQRPERTRQSRLPVAKRSTSVQDNRLSPARQREMSLEEKQRIYGSTHIPGSTRQRPTIRTVKSYTQRLQEMKQGSGKENEIHWRYQTGSARSQPQSAYGKSEMQTTQRRQQSSKERHDSKSATFKAPPPASTGLRWHRPAHPPRTYTEQLQELQRPATVRLEKMRPATSRLVPQQRLFEKSVGLVPRSQRRNRPYADPYSDVDVSSDFSSWSMDENVRKILYGDRSPLPTASDTELSELMAIRDRESPLDYTDMVNVEDLEMIDGVSINSCLDWEEIDRMVAEIN